MTKMKMRPEGMRMEAKMDKDDKNVRAVKMTFMNGEEEFTLKLDMEFLKAVRDAADALIQKNKEMSGQIAARLPGYV